MAEQPRDNPRQPHVVVTTHDGGMRIKLTGEIDLTCEAELDAALHALLSRPPGEVTVDLADTAFLGSSGVEFLARLHNKVEPLGTP
jgi:anti-anti-sigma factor